MGSKGNDEFPLTSSLFINQLHCIRTSKKMSTDQNIICAEHAWCQEFLKKKQQHLDCLTGKNVIVQKMTLRRQRFDCRTREAQIQQDVFKIYEPMLLELDAKLSSRIALTNVSSSLTTQPTDFQLRCNSEVNQQFIETVGGRNAFENLERRFIK